MVRRKILGADNFYFFEVSGECTVIFVLKLHPALYFRIFTLFYTDIGFQFKSLLLKMWY